MPIESQGNSKVNRDGKIVINRIFNHFHVTGVWPNFGQLDKPIYKEEQLDLVVVLRGIPSNLISYDRNAYTPSDNFPIQLRLAAIAMCSGAESDLELYFEALRWFADREILSDTYWLENQLVITRTEYLNHLSETDIKPSWLHASKLATLILTEGSLYRGGFAQSPTGEWTVFINRNIRHFRNVFNLQDYEDAVASVISILNTGLSSPGGLTDAVEGELDESLVPNLQNLPVMTEQDNLIADRYIFVIMPFEEPWSDDSYEFIKNSISRLPKNLILRLYRADEITQTGDISLQIIEAIRGATLILADMTSIPLRRDRFGFGKRIFIPNANVMYELGYSMALESSGGAPIVLINQNPKNAPFDLSHIRQVQYSVPARERELNWLAQVIETNLP